MDNKYGESSEEDSMCNPPQESVNRLLENSTILSNFVYLLPFGYEHNQEITIINPPSIDANYCSIVNTIVVSCKPVNIDGSTSTTTDDNGNIEDSALFENDRSEELCIRNPEGINITPQARFWQAVVCAKKIYELEIDLRESTQEFTQKLNKKESSPCKTCKGSNNKAVFQYLVNIDYQLEQWKLNKETLLPNDLRSITVDPNLFADFDYLPLDCVIGLYDYDVTDKFN